MLSKEDKEAIELAARHFVRDTDMHRAEILEELAERLETTEDAIREFFAQCEAEAPHDDG